MNCLILSDTYTVASFDEIYNYIKNNIFLLKPDVIIVNGNLVGFHNEKKSNNLDHFKKSGIYSSEKIIDMFDKVKKGVDLKDNDLNNLGVWFNDYLHERYMWVIHAIRKLSMFSKVYYNLGENESPIHLQLYAELSSALNIDPTMVHKILKTHPDEKQFEIFKEKLRSLANVEFISQKVIQNGDCLIVGIPGLASMAKEYYESMENITDSILKEINEKLPLSKSLLIFTHNKESHVLVKYLFSKNTKQLKIICKSAEETKLQDKNSWNILSVNKGNTGNFITLDTNNISSLTEINVKTKLKNKINLS